MDHNVIPKITHPLGKEWGQPDMSNVLIDDTHAIMDKVTFIKLAEYSYTQPTGCYEGKVWKCVRDGQAWLFWFGFSDKPSMCSTNCREILVV